MDDIIEKIAALGIPGLVLIVAVKATGYFGAAALTTALASLGGPFGMLAGIGTLGVIGLIAQGMSRFGFEAIFKSVLVELYKQGHTKEELLAKIKAYPISRNLKNKLIDHVNKFTDQH